MREGIIGLLAGFILGVWLLSEGLFSANKAAVASGYLVHDSKAYRVTAVGSPEPHP